MKKIPVKRTGTRVVFQARLSFVHLDQPWSGTDGNEKKYSVSAIIPKGDTDIINAIREAIESAVTEGTAKCWQGKRPNVKASNFKYPLKDGDTDRDDDPVYAGAMFISASSKTQPATLNRLKEKIAPEEVYSGCYGLVSVNFFPFSKGSNGVAAGLNSVLKLYDGERLGGGGDGSRDFDDIEGLDEVEDLEDL